MFTNREFLELLSRAWHRAEATRDALPEGLEQDELDRQVSILRERWGAMLTTIRHPPTDPGRRFDFYMPDDTYELVMQEGTYEQE